MLLLGLLNLRTFVCCLDVANSALLSPANSGESDLQATSSLQPGANMALKESKPIVRLHELTVHEREFVSPQVRVQMECQRDKTIMKVNFTQPFNGILGAGRLDTTKCKQFGNGTKYYEIIVKHNATQCDTEWDAANSGISNTLFIRFHSSLETGSDIAKNIMCRLNVGELVVGRRPIKMATDGKPLLPSKPNQSESQAWNAKESGRR